MGSTADNNGGSAVEDYEKSGKAHGPALTRAMRGAPTPSAVAVADGGVAVGKPRLCLVRMGSRLIMAAWHWQGASRPSLGSGGEGNAGLQPLRPCAQQILQRAPCLES